MDISLSRFNPVHGSRFATHFPVADDTVACALESVRKHVPNITCNKDYDPVNKNIVWSFDLMVIRLFAGENRILQQIAKVSDYGFSPPVQTPDGVLPPKYHDANGNWDPYAQIDRTMEIPAEEYGATAKIEKSGIYK